MYKLIFFGLFSLNIISIGNAETYKSSDADNTQTGDCERIANWGDLEICLPKIDNMKECYLTPNVKELADKFEAKGNSVISFYLNTDTYNQVDSLEYISYDDYFKIYATDEIKNMRLGKAELKEFADLIGSNFISKEWDSIEEKLSDDIGDFAIGVPHKIESYSPTKNVNTFVMITKYGTDTEYEYSLVMTMNLVLIKNRMIWLAYYKDFDGDESIRLAKKKNDEIILSLLKANE